VFTGEQREGLLRALREDPEVSHVAVLRRLGVPGTKGQLRRAIDGQLRAEIAAIRKAAEQRRLEEKRRRLAKTVGADEEPTP
jgi:hypothetical protein